MASSVLWSRAENDSSNTKQEGFTASALAILKRAASPPATGYTSFDYAEKVNWPILKPSQHVFKT